VPVPTIEWVGGVRGHVRFIDQTRLPGELRLVRCRDAGTVYEAIRALRVRGAPAIGIAAAMGVVLAVRSSMARSSRVLARAACRAADHLATARPTAVNLFWALDRMRRTAAESAGLTPARFRKRLLREALTIWEEDRWTCRRIGRNGAALIRDGATVLTHCNAGGLATADYGTALAAVFTAHEQGKRVRVFADETRPLLQGARLTTWELMRAGIDVTLICDSTAAAVMKQGKVDLVLVGADRIASNGDTANKVGTYGLAVLARAHGIPFYVAAPISTFDPALRSGSEIPIEERSGKEITCAFGRRIAPDGVRTYSPAFDVTPARYITAIITEQGLIRRPSATSVRRHLAEARK